MTVAKKRGLGRGLEALLGPKAGEVAPLEAQPGEALRRIPVAQLQAGKSYLRLKQVDKAMAAFDRAVERAPSPGTWNSIAYELSLQGVQLDRAQQYAESAVASATAASRNLDVARGDSTSLGVVLLGL